MKILNEIVYLPCAIQQFYDHVDHILLVEGCDSYMRRSTDRVTDEGLSTDGTTEIIESFPDPEGKIEHVKLGFYDEEEESFQRMMDGLKAGDILWTAAPDEFFLQSYLLETKRILEGGSCLTMRFCFLTYWHDFYHLLRGGGWDNELARAWVLVEDGDKMHMLGKGASLVDSQGRDYKSAYYTGTTQVSSGLIHHMSYVRTAEKVMEKIAWQLEIEERWSEATEASPVSPGPAKLDCYTLKKKYKTKENWIRRNFPWFNCVYDQRYNIRVESWNGPWPEALEGHEYWNLYWDENEITLL